MTDHGLFVDRRTHWEGRIGAIRARFAIVAGGAVALGLADAQGELTHPLLTIAPRLRLLCTCKPGSPDHGQTVLIRQENDPRPKLNFLEEGPVRIGMRSTFDLLDDQGHYHGGGRQDVWLYPEGDIHLTCTLETEDLLAHGPTHDCFLEILGAADYRQIELGTRKVAAGDPEVTQPLGDAFPDKAIYLSSQPGGPAAALYWARDRGIPFDFGSDHGAMPPYFATRWPTGMQQWAKYGQRMGWALEPSAAVTASLTPAGPRLQMAWMREATTTGNTIVGATLIISLGRDPAELRRRVRAVQEPLAPTIIGGKLRCYTEEDGLYEVAQAHPGRVAITFPPDPLARTARVRWFRRKTDPWHRGAVVAQAQGKAIPVQLISDGGLTDDICVPMERSHRNHPADDVIVSTPLSPDHPTELVLEKVPGIQAVYQTETTGLDLQRRGGNRRDLAVWNSKHPASPLFEFDLFSIAAHRLTAPGQSLPAVWEAPLAWFHDSGHARYDYCDAIDALTIEKNGPDELRLYTRSFNPNRRTQSELWLRVPFNHPRLRFEARLRMTVLDQWDCWSCEVSDIFPFPSRLIETWYYQGVLFMEPGKESLVFTYRPDTSHRDTRPSTGNRMFYSLFSSDRGNVLTLFENHTPVQPGQTQPAFVCGVCGHYIDIHVHFRPAVVPVPAGTVFDVSSIFELYGDGRTGVDELRQIGERSLAAGDLVLRA